MHPNATLLTRFYTAFQHRDYAIMQSCYADNATFSDPVFVGLDAGEVRAMWEMLIKNGKDLELTFTGVRADDRHGQAQWTARYTFGATGNKVVNRIQSTFLFENGRIVRQTDAFDFYKWARQALGLTGLLLGWTPFLKNNVRRQARGRLGRFMEKRGGA